ncbi:membrane protein [Arcticibacter tournemirensis]|uniref:YihY/virulence factor BrkB family protein n=1 Tax=Arcticibacter tournemirensis TaxID=699437 RepID=A0A5M9HG29_9SPHI|nr:YihY/virulence factor BrkB family protein [Arcticibacter tournemirensis]KAA8485503.1 YihY/virulence factor BrkB family protein [Arcticibacter tournemirensis]TQM48791.1 membrane protein [Arcticibacter tournemirensis]
MRLNKQYFKDLWFVVLGAGKAFGQDKAMKYSASLAYSTVFALSPLLVLIISLASIFYEKGEIQSKLFREIGAMVGPDTSHQLQLLIEKSAVSGGSTISLIISIVVLLIGATAIFTEIQDTLNIIWRVRPKPKKGFQKLLINRILSFSMIISLGFLLVVSLIINGIVAAISERLTIYFPDITIILVMAFNVVLTFVIISVLFGIIFKFLPDVRISWKDVRVGAIATALLFMLGRFLIGMYLQIAGTGSAFGAAGSVVVILTWVYYTAAILYFGAEFTQVYAEKFGTAIKPSPYAVHVVQQEEEVEVDELPPQGHCGVDADSEKPEDCDT